MTRFTLIFILGTVLILSQVAAELTCSPSNSSEMRVTFDGHRNKTGHWIHEIGLEHQGLPSSSMFDRKSVPWTVDVKYGPKNCDDKQKNSLKLLISFSESRYAADYVLVPGLGFYKYYPTLVTWGVAKTTCEQDGAHLAIINSQQEADALKKMVVNISSNWAWVGLVKNDPKGEFVTIFGDPISSTGFSTWYSGVNPASAGANSVADFHKVMGTLSYSSTPMTTTLVFLCEKY